MTKRSEEFKTLLQTEYNIIDNKQWSISCAFFLASLNDAELIDLTRRALLYCGMRVAGTNEYIASYELTIEGLKETLKLIRKSIV